MYVYAFEALCIIYIKLVSSYIVENHVNKCIGLSVSITYVL